MSAIDSDEQAENRRFNYRISGGDLDGNFRIDSASGWITTDARLDREEQETHTFTVVAIDSGSPPRTGTIICRFTFSKVLKIFLKPRVNVALSEKQEKLEITKGFMSSHSEAIVHNPSGVFVT